MSEEATIEKPMPIIPMLRSDFMSVLAIGAVAGLLVWAIGFLFDRFVFDMYFCQNEISAQCASAKNYSAVAAGLIVALAALGGLVRVRVYRPLLVLIASFLSLWGLAQLSWGLEWSTGLPVMMLLYALAFGLYTWVARIREFWVSLIIVVLLVVAVRLVLVA